MDNKKGKKKEKAEPTNINNPPPPNIYLHARPNDNHMPLIGINQLNRPICNLETVKDPSENLPNFVLHPLPCPTTFCKRGAYFFFPKIRLFPNFLGFI